LFTRPSSIDTRCPVCLPFHLSSLPGHGHPFQAFHSVSLPPYHGLSCCCRLWRHQPHEPNKSFFVLYHFVSGLNIHMGNNSYVPVLGCGTAIFSLKGKRVLIRNVLHVPGLAVPFYRLRTHMTQPGCGFFGSASLGSLVYFLAFVLLVNTSVDCHLSFEPLGSSAPLSTLHYTQPCQRPTYYPYERMSSSTAAVPPVPGPVLIPDDASMVAPDVMPLPNSSVDPPSGPFSSSQPPLLTISIDNIKRLLHHPGSFFPPIWPCDTANASNTKTHWSAEELH
jgi:hypothetical protein